MTPPQPAAPLKPLPARRIRGLKNLGNTCFANCVLQSLLSCDDFRRYLLSCRGATGDNELLKHFVDLALAMSVGEDDKAEIVTRDKTKLPNYDEPVAAKWAHEFYFAKQPTTNGVAGTQEDAEEFLTATLNGLHESLVTAENNTSTPAPVAAPADDEDEWQEITRGGHAANVAGTTGPEVPRSAVTRIFGGAIRYETHRPNVPRRLTREPFLHLDLTIESGAVRSVSDALTKYFCYEHVEGADVRRQVTLDSLPPVLVLHLKRTRYQTGAGSEKVCRRLDFQDTLVVGRSLCAAAIPLEQRTYHLAAAVTHCGRDSDAGHYVADVRVKQPAAEDAPDLWVHCDDSNVTRTTLPNVLRRQAYLLFFARGG